MPEVGSGLRVEDTSLVRVWEQRSGLVCVKTLALFGLVVKPQRPHIAVVALPPKLCQYYDR